jgi:hypothetical protein
LGPSRKYAGESVWAGLPVGTQVKELVLNALQYNFSLHDCKNILDLNQLGKINSPLAYALL